MIISELSSLKVSFQELSDNVTNTNATVFNLRMKDNCLWTPSVKTGGRDVKFRNKLMKEFGYSMKDVAKYPVCMVTGIRGDGKQVIAGHIIPCKTKLHKLEALELTEHDLNDVRNGCFWVKGIEDCWENMDISFVQTNPLEDKLRLKIWTDSCRDVKLFEGSTNTVGDYEGYELSLGSHTVFKRGLSCQAYFAYLHHYGIGSKPSEECIFGTPIRFHREIVHTMKMNVYKAIDADRSGDDSEYDDGDSDDDYDDADDYDNSHVDSDVSDNADNSSKIDESVDGFSRSESSPPTSKSDASTRIPSAV